MKYHKPELHFISAAMTSASCVSGSVAIPVQECTVGPGVTVGKCSAGIVPGQKCSIGTSPFNCTPVGANVGAVCVTGGRP